jgi:hypothetical protein
LSGPFSSFRRELACDAVSVMFDIFADDGTIGIKYQFIIWRGDTTSHN